MVFKLKTSKRTMDIYKQIEKREHLQPFVLVKLSLALAINNGYIYDGSLSDTAGLELNRAEKMLVLIVGPTFKIQNVCS